MEINCLHFNTIDSTNTWSKENYKKFNPSRLTIVSADQQTAGVGRYKRQWVSPKQNIYVTFTFFLEAGRSVANIAQVLALSASKVLEMAGFNPLLKWPNDILLHKKKVSGILCETIMEEMQLVVCLGIGININMTESELHQINQPATSLYHETGRTFEINALLQLLQIQFKNDLELFLNKGFEPFLESYKAHLVHKKGDIIQGQNFAGAFERIADDGALILRNNGKEESVYSGEIL